MQQILAAVHVLEDAYFITNSALYTAENIRNLQQDLHWITHVPSTITEVKTLLHADVPMNPGKDPRYSFYETTLDYGGIHQKCVLVHSKEMQARKEKSFEKSFEKIDVQTTKSFKKLLELEFDCEMDAQAAADHWAKNHLWYQYTQFAIIPTSRKIEVKRERPRNDEERRIVYTIQAEIARNT